MYDESMKEVSLEKAKRRQNTDNTGSMKNVKMLEIF